VHVQVSDLLKLARLMSDAGAAPKDGTSENRGVAQHCVTFQGPLATLPRGKKYAF
jgi:hypothetical protein